MSNESRIPTIKAELTDRQEFIDYLCSIPDDRYQVVFPLMKLAKLLEHQRVSDEDKKNAEDVRTVYSMESPNKLVLMAFLYGKIQGKREERK